jgi:hypothetical protein
MASDPKLRFSLQLSGDRFTLIYDGYLADTDEAALLDLEMRVLTRPQRSTILFVQGNEFVGFHRSQVGKHAQALARMKHKLDGIAIANASGPVRFAIASVSMLVRVPLRGFDNIDDANRWLDGQRRAAAVAARG